MLWTCLLFPSLPLDVFARGWHADAAARPFAVASGGHYPHVVAANTAARAAGIKRGQLISGALALAPDIALRDRDPAAEAAALGELATWALRFTPQACLAPPDAVVAEISGSVRLFGGLSQLATGLTRGVQARGYATRLGIAPTPLAALACARAGHATPIVDPQELAAVLAPLPLALFDVDPRARDTLRAAGVTTFGDADALPRAGLARRCGPELVATLDRALGRMIDARAPHIPPPRYEGRLALPAPVHDAAALGFAVNRLVHELSAWLLARGLGAVRLQLTLVHERYMQRRLGIPATVVPLALGAPARAAAHLTGVLRERLARVALPAPVETIVLATADTTPLAGRNLGLLPGDDADAALVPLIDRLRARLGDDSVVQVAPYAEHRPERANRLSDDCATPKHRSDLSPTIAAGAASAATAPRPVWLLDAPEPLGRRLEHAPWVLRDGPERIESGWWDGGDVRRDYFVAQAPHGEIVWIYRDHRRGIDDGDWFVHGLFA
jgi:protein ImuB